MSLEFVLGAASLDHRSVLVDELATELTEHPNDQFYYLVPNHIKFESEVAILSQLKHQLAPDQALFAQTQVQVFSMSRLAWYFMKNEPVYQVPRLSTAGTNMLLYQIIKAHQAELTVFRGEVERPGFLTQLTQQLGQLKVGRITAADLVDVVNGMDDDNPAALQGKLHDLLIIYQAFEEATTGQFIDNADILNQLTRFLITEDLSHAHFYIEGLSQMTAQERQLVDMLVQQSASVSVALTLDKPYVSARPEKQNLFYQSGKLYHQLYVSARAAHVKILLDRYAKHPRVCADLVTLDRYWQESTNMTPITAPQLENSATVQILAADNRYVEVAQVATRIRQMVATGNYRYQDFLVLTRHLAPYQTVIDPIFRMQQIPYFDDADVAMADHPFVELINALFDMDRRHYRYGDVMRVLKTELMLPVNDQNHPLDIPTYRQDLALAENLVLKNGYEGEQKWTQDQDWQYAWFTEGDDGIETTRNQELTAKINVIRHFVKQTFPPFFKRLNRATTYREALTILYQFLDQHGVVDQLQGWRNEALETGDLVRAGQPEQTWATFCDMLDEFVAILGDEPFDLADFQALMQAGFEGASFSQIPSTLDQVLISESGITQAGNRKITFMIGSTDNTMPDSNVSEGLLSDLDKTVMMNQLDETVEADEPDHYLPDDAATQLAGEPYLNYLAFLASSEQLIFTYPLSTGDDADARLSPYVARIQKYFNLKPQHCPANPAPDSEQMLSYVGTPRATLRHLVQASHRSDQDQLPLAASWVYVNHKLRKNIDLAPLTQTLLGSLSYQNVPQTLNQDVVASLYGSTINTSISKLEEYYRNPYAYFLKYGLKLQERDVFEMSPANIGEFFHAVMDQLLKLIHEQRVNLADLDEQQTNELVDEVVSKTLDTEENPQFTILESSNRMGYIRDQLIQTIKQMAGILHKQSQHTRMRSQQTEVMFGQIGAKQGLASLDFKLPQDREVRVRGKIDRIDALRLDDKTYLGIVDYKSSDHKFDFGLAYYGAAMQMITYLDAVRQNLAELAGDSNGDVQLAGAVYLHLKNPVLKPTDLQKDDFATALLKNDQYNGLLLNDPEFLDEIDDAFANDRTGYSKLYKGVQKKKDGSYSMKDVLVTPEELDLLIHNTERRIKEAAAAIFNGRIDLTPLRFGGVDLAMPFSPYKSIMQFDPMLPENNYRDLNRMKKQDILDRLREEQEDQHGEI
ncbi:PD-(D/E)XK nuclease family protein [Levilactobacillus bambusae]|uniref:ATP-dependent helicase/deoxyribonuclease subunit B n=1 Tax=Levilactobacillus bambusae TaxID=2024736 RepID=A0A2V1MZW5_9LACO|nr:PD-(D/E)XK nuclease family protein [Levilactobacillus bambusae]PWG00561.1 ATP-dependent helicase [Levilactobacillus bambusae]